MIESCWTFFLFRFRKEFVLISKDLDWVGRHESQAALHLSPRRRKNETSKSVWFDNSAVQFSIHALSVLYFLQYLFWSLRVFWITKEFNVFLMNYFLVSWFDRSMICLHFVIMVRLDPRLNAKTVVETGRLSFYQMHLGDASGVAFYNTLSNAHNLTSYWDSTSCRAHLFICWPETYICTDLNVEKMFHVNIQWTHPELCTINNHFKTCYTERLNRNKNVISWKAQF